MKDLADAAILASRNRLRPDRFNRDIERVEREDGDRVRITYEGKFLTYQW